TGGTADRNRSHWSTSKTPSYTKSVSWQHHHSAELNYSDFGLCFLFTKFRLLIWLTTAPSENYPDRKPVHAA
ncbi:hypothetical protein, partial [Shigella sonnei]|uniref:hypothetical protein n=1 Tax=Shigella sonnei TaxID=624 RepID=UPI001C0A79CE